MPAFSPKNATENDKNRRGKGFLLGAVPGVAKGTHFDSFNDMRLAGVHRCARAGIAARQDVGVASVVLNGKYDDKDFGDVIWYTGCGGLEPGSMKQVQDQNMDTPPHRAFLRSLARGKPVRVVRGCRALSECAPARGYRYDGLYRVTEAKEEVGPHGLVRCMFRLEKIPEPEAAVQTPAAAQTQAAAQAQAAAQPPAVAETQAAPDAQAAPVVQAAPVAHAVSVAGDEEQAPMVSARRAWWLVDEWD